MGALQPKFDIIIPTGQDDHDNLYEMQYHDKPIREYRPLIRLCGKPLIQHVIDEIADADNGLVAESIGLKGSISSITIVGKRESLEDVVQQRQHPIKYLDLGENVLDNVWKGFCNLFPDSQPLPDLGKAILYLTGTQTYSLEMFDSRLRQEAEFLAAIAKHIQDSGIGKICLSEADVVVKEKSKELVMRGFQPSGIDDNLIASLILSSAAKAKNLQNVSGSVFFAKPEEYQYFLDFYSRLEKEITFLACDTPILNPGFMVFLKQCSQVEADFKMGMTTEPYLSPYYEPNNFSRSLGFTRYAIPSSVAYKEKYDKHYDGVRRPYMQMERLTRVMNMANIKPNKIGKKEKLQEAFSLRKQRDIRNWAKILWALPRDAKKFGAYLIAAYCLNIMSPYHSEHGIYRKMTRQLTYGRVEHFASEIIGGSAKVILNPYGIMSIDADHQKDVPAFEKYLEQWKARQHGIDYRPFVQ